VAVGSAAVSPAHSRTPRPCGPVPNAPCASLCESSLILLCCGAQSDRHTYDTHVPKPTLVVSCFTIFYQKVSHPECTPRGSRLSNFHQYLMLKIFASLLRISLSQSHVKLHTDEVEGTKRPPGSRVNCSYKNETNLSHYCSPSKPRKYIQFAPKKKAQIEAVIHIQL
jgi:hypothetical protein